MARSTSERDKSPQGREDPPGVVIHRSSRRRKTVQAHVDDGVLHVFLPDNLSYKRELEWVDKMRESIWRQQEKKKAADSIDLEGRANALNRKYFAGALSWQSIRFTPPSKSRYGSCRPGRGEILISAELRDHPAWVLDYVIIHELAHLVFADHSREFWHLVSAYPKAERARGFLDGFARAGGRRRAPCGSDKRTEEASEQLALIT